VALGSILPFGQKLKTQILGQAFQWITSARFRMYEPERHKPKGNSPFTRAASNKTARRKTKILSVMIATGTAKSLRRARERNRHD
jgi:hypothetical protein